MKNLVDLEFKVLLTLKDSEKEIFEDFTKLQGIISSISTTDGFVVAFLLGMRIEVKVLDINK